MNARRFRVQRAAWLVPLGWFAASRAVVLIAAGATMGLVPRLGFTRLLTAWDGGWYLEVAAHGYPRHVPAGNGNAAQNATAFFPLYPLLVRAVMRTTGLSAFRAGFVTSFALGAGASVAIWALVRALADRGTADRAVALWCFFPASFVLSLPYSEGAMVLAAAGSLLLLHKKRWVGAGLLAACASAARPTGIAVAVACFVAAVVAIRRGRDWRAPVAPLLAPFGLVAFCAYLRAHTGDALVSFETQRRGWHQNLDFGATTYHAIARAFTDPFDNLNRVALVVALVLVLVGAVFLRSWRPPAFVVAYAVTAIVPALLVASIASRPRFLFAAFPFVVAPAWRLRGPAFAAWLALSAGLLAVTTMLSVSMLSLTP